MNIATWWTEIGKMINVQSHVCRMLSERGIVSLRFHKIVYPVRDTLNMFYTCVFGNKLISDLYGFIRDTETLEGVSYL